MFLLLLLCLVGVETALGLPHFEYGCTFTSSTGDYYDFSPLSKCDNTGYYVDGGRSTFAINFCNSVNTSLNTNVKKCDPEAAVCQSSDYGSYVSAGTASSGVFSDVKGTTDKRVLLQYTGGDHSCGTNQATPRTTKLTLICNKDYTSNPKIVFTAENPSCTFNFDVYSAYACPVKKGPQIQICPIYVYVVPHTHDDVGWIVTPDEAYNSQVRSIITTVVTSLAANPSRRFIYVEQAYFYRWWTDPAVSADLRNTFKKVYANGQLEFVIGGWVMEDEACTTFGADIDQLTLGHQFVYTNFGARPNKGWQLDPFGQTTVTATIQRLAGFDAHLIDRVSNKDYYRASKNLQFMWYGSPSLNEKASIFTEIMDGAINAYCDWYFAFKFDQDTVNSGNVQKYAQTFYQMVYDRVPDVLTNNILAAWGCDMAFGNATRMFENMDYLIDYLQKHQEETHIFVKYTTVSDYFSAVMNSPNVKFPENHGTDFLPLNENLYWTGYYTSRTQLKGVVRQGEAAAYMAEPLYVFGRMTALVNSTANAYPAIEQLRMANAEAQHHDGVTGTSMGNVVQYFQDNIKSKASVTNKIGASVLRDIIVGKNVGKNAPVLSTTSDDLLRIQPGQTVAVIAYNSLSWDRNEVLELPVNRQDLTVVDNTKKTVPAQVGVARSMNSTGKFNLFISTSIPALGFKTYFVICGASGIQTPKPEVVVGKDISIENDYIAITVSGNTGRLANMTNKKTKVSVKLDQNFLSYTSEIWQSGAYAFTPVGPASPVSATSPSNTVTTGPVFSEIYQTFTTNASSSASFVKQTIRVYHLNGNSDAENFFELKSEIGVLPSRTEVITRFTTDISSESAFFTDDNGFEFLSRTSSYEIPISGNYYPLIYSSFIKDDHNQLTVSADRTHGCSSLADGQFEVMLHRNPDQGDFFGPFLTDTDVVHPVLRVSVDSVENSKLVSHQQPYFLNFPVATFTSVLSVSIDDWNKLYKVSYNFIAKALPPNVRLLSLSALDATTKNCIIRFTHLFAVNEHETYSAPVTIDLTQLFVGFTIKSLSETTLTANKVIGQATTTITLHPKDIKTYVIQFA